MFKTWDKCIPALITCVCRKQMTIIIVVKCYHYRSHNKLVVIFSFCCRIIKHSCVRFQYETKIIAAIILGKRGHRNPVPFKTGTEVHISKCIGCLTDYFYFIPVSQLERWELTYHLSKLERYKQLFVGKLEGNLCGASW